LGLGLKEEVGRGRRLHSQENDFLGLSSKAQGGGKGRKKRGPVHGRAVSIRKTAAYKREGGAFSGGVRSCL